ncbi:condensation domain-containing protein [Rhizobium halophytocola]|uniref:Acyl carrier protein n=1 Tax=Rhizobium halophytocola TaxID=735519 RepID=A0ABS4DV41_9HYPH|nr:condensation domain-containing protein [Rhizobium halophytocola]MBP1849563.1 acyl carrier protein [Rhizobium halophytocola]
MPLNATRSAAQDDRLPGAEPGSGQRPSEYEEHIWLSQLQQPETIFRRLLSYQLSGLCDIARLSAAITRLTDSWPALTVRFRFSEDGDLIRQPAEPDTPVVEILRAQSRADATALLLDRQSRPFDAEQDPPFEALLILSEGETVMALLIHRLLDESCPVEAILAGIADAYAARPIAPPDRRILSIPAASAPPSSLAWLQRPTAVGPVLPLDEGIDPTRPPAHPQAHRFSATLPARLLTATDQPPAPGDLLARLAARFGLFLAGLGDGQPVTIALPRHPTRHLGEPGVMSAADETVHVTLSSDLAIDAAEAEIIARRDGKLTAPAAPPVATVTFLSDPTDFFQLPDMHLRRLALPIRDPLAGLTLGAGMTPQGDIALELTLEHVLSRHAGGMLLERFLAFLAGVTDIPTIARRAGLRPVEVSPTTPAAAAPVRDGSTDDATTIAALILAEFREALASPDMTATDDFFDHGGHSLIATRIIGRLLGHHGIEIHFNDLFSYPTAGELARHATRVTPETDNAFKTSAASDDSPSTAPLSLAQMSLWKAYRAFGFNEIFNIPFALEFLDPVDEHAFECAFLDLIERHPGLRTCFAAHGDSVMQSVVPMHDLSRYTWFWGSADSIGVTRQSEAGYRFDLATELPIRLRFLKDAETGRQTLSFLFHHIVLDEWSVNLMMDELAEAYRARIRGQAPQWSSSPAPFHEFARTQAAAGVDPAHLSYWTAMLVDAPRTLGIAAPEISPAPAETDTSPAGGWVEFKLEPSVSDGLYRLARQNSASLFNIVYAAIAASLRSVGDIDDLVVGTSASGRTDPAYFDTIGYFTTVVAHRLRMNGTMTVGALVTSVKDTINGSMPHSDIPIDLVEEALGLTPGRDHLFELFIQIHAKNKLNGALPGPDGQPIEFRQVDPDKHESLLGLQFEVMEEMIAGERAIRVLMSYRTEHYGPDQVERIRAVTSATFARFAEPDASNRPLRELV